ncbi:LysR substrate-binding domain-containing protein [Rhizobium halophytocola]|uniref:LysR family glycine cleavage system transcriptional activator n=1 Tax=Rhizobium halophytocola TaxID=735519 RepID=A0ABS4E0V0_9HYPH|nr:LysR substrate-binding domain-containing protein [Rhizobium halophytocola]MBP1851568.1 LysR family glycine cleavage system transcriptional activator [Rhizobium halophytocola]
MVRRLPPLNPLRAFEAAARHGSVSLAAQELNVTHGAISHQIKSLEATLGVSLFERGGQRIKLTPQGAQLLPSVSSAFTEIATATARLTRPTTSGTLTVACIPALMSFWLMPRIGEFVRQFPDIRLTLISSNDAANISNPAVDLCVLYGNGKWPDCWARLWSSLEFFPVASPTMLNSRPLRNLRDLRDHVLLHADADGQEWTTWLTAIDARGFIDKDRQHFMGDARLATEAALHGLGIAMGDSITARGLIDSGDLVVPFNLAVPANEAFYIAAREEVQGTMIARVFIDWLFATLEAAAPHDPRLSARHMLRRRPESETETASSG